MELVVAFAADAPVATPPATVVVGAIVSTDCCPVAIVVAVLFGIVPPLPDPPLPEPTDGAVVVDDVDVEVVDVEVVPLGTDVEVVLVVEVVDEDVVEVDLEAP